jgi:hypothetical protein
MIAFAQQPTGDNFVSIDILRRTVAPRITLLAEAALAVALVGALAGCSPLDITRAGGIGASSPAVLQCNQSPDGYGVDVVYMKLTCQASGAASGDTSFQLHYTTKNSNGHARSFDALCAGTLTHGVGTCTQTYALVVPIDTGSATISGEFLPSHKALGPLPLSQSNT